MVRQGAAIDLVWVQSQGKAVGVIGSTRGTERAKVWAVLLLLRFEATSCEFCFPPCPSVLSVHIMLVTRHLPATGTSVPKPGVNPEVYPWIVLPSCIPLSEWTTGPFFLLREPPAIEGLQLPLSLSMYLCAFFLADKNGVTRENSFAILDNKHFVLY